MGHKPYTESHHNALEECVHAAGALLLFAGTISSSSLLRDVLVISFLTILLLLVVAGVGYEVWRIKARDAEEADAFYAKEGKDGVDEFAGVSMATFESNVELAITEGGGRGEYDDSISSMDGGGMVISSSIPPPSLLNSMEQSSLMMTPPPPPGPGP